MNATKPRRLRFGLRGLLVAVLVFGLAFGWIAREARKARARETLFAELGRMKVHSNGTQPTFLCLFAMKVLCTDSRDAEKRLGKWLGPGWFGHPRGFNAGRLPADRVMPVVAKLRPFGT